MAPKKTETATKPEGAAAAPKAKSSGPQHTYQVRTYAPGLFSLFSASNESQDMITDAIIAVISPVPFHPAHLRVLRPVGIS